MSTATTHAWLRRVSDYCSGGVSASERAAVEAHLVTCAECWRALAAYRRFDALVQSPLRLGDSAVGILAGYRPMLLEETIPPTDRDTRNSAPQPPRRTALLAPGAIAAVLVIALLASALFAHFRTPTQPVTPRPTATPALDSQSQVYVTLLRTYYIPVADANDPAAQCFSRTKSTQQAQVMATCRSPMAAQLALAQTLHTQLASVSVPARWQSQHVALQQAVEGMIAMLTEQVAAIDAQDLTRFLNTQDIALSKMELFCAPIAQLNAGPPELSPKLYVPAPSTC